MTTLVHERVERARSGTNETLISRLPSGWAVLGDHQFLPGYSLLLPDPVAPSLNELSTTARLQYLSDMARLGDALLAATDAVRINYAIYGNHDWALHAHLFPRYEWEPDEYRTGPVWKYPKEQRDQDPFEPERHAQLIQRIKSHLRIEELRVDVDSLFID